MNKEIFVTFIDENTKQEFEKLKEEKYEDKQLYEILLKAVDVLKINPSSGIKIARNLWPKEYQNYQISNLWKLNLPNAWRLIYTIESTDIKIISIILEWFPHKEYEKRFKY